MSVVVKGMEMPVSCIACRFVEGVWCCAKPTEMSREELLGDNRPGWCPLVELPHGHGRLIDADEFADEMRKRQDAAGKWLRGAKDYETADRADAVLNFLCEVKLTLDDMETIVEAEGD